MSHPQASSNRGPNSSIIVPMRRPPPTSSKTEPRRWPAAPLWPLAVLLGLLLSGCQEIKIPGVYRIDIQQGNVITQAQLAKLEPGMERRKVRFILGTPLVADAFNQNRWDYYYSYEPGNGERVQRIISVYFDDKGLVRVGGDVRAASGPIKVEERRDELVKVPPGLNDESIFASLTPDFLSNRKKTIDLAKLEKSSKQNATAPEQQTTEIPEVNITDADRDFLKDLLKEYGKTDQPATAAIPVATAAQKLAPDDDTTSKQSGEEGESLFSNWARKLGFKSDDKTADDNPQEPAPPAQDATVPPPEAKPE